MANRNFPSNKEYNFHVMKVMVDAQISIGASGAPAQPTSQTGAGIASISRLAAGIYQIQLQDNYAKNLMVDASMHAPAPGSAVSAGSFVSGTPYSIASVGSTNFQAIGLPADVSAAAGAVFVATGAGSGSGTAIAITSSGIDRVEQLSPLQNSNAPVSGVTGAYMMIQCLNSSGTPTDPAAGSVMHLRLMLSNSSVQ